MANKKFIHFVENQCKTFCKSPCISKAKLCVKNLSTKMSVKKTNLFTAFSNIIHHAFHKVLPLDSIYLFHYSTDPTITTINNLIIRKD